MKKEKEVVRSKNCYGKNGISLISLIITIIVIIILAAIVIFSGLNTPDRANLAKFAQSFSDYNTAIMGDFTKKKTQYAVGGQSRTDAQIYYIIATGNENIVDVNDAPTPVATIEKLGLNLHPEQLTGTEYYEITSDSNIEGVNKQMQFYEASEKHYVTDKGEAFVLPGYLVPGTNRWYINEKKYYESDEPIKGPFSFDVSECKLLSEDDENSEEVQGKLGKGVDTAYIYFTATANGEPATISYTQSSGGETISDTGKIRLPISDNGEYNFTITATVDGAQKTTTKKITIVDRFVQMTEASAFKFTASSGTITGLATGYENLEEINIPSKIGKYNVIKIGNRAFADNKNITKVTIPSSVTQIENMAFCDCSNLIGVTIPEGVTSIGEYAFDGCSSLASIIIPKGNESIGRSAFEDCTSLTSIIFQEGHISIGEYAFQGCTSLASVTISEGVASIGKSAFKSCTSLTSATILGEVTSIGESAFESCSNLENVILPEGVTSIEKNAFRSCTKLASIIIPQSVTNIKSFAFSNCNSLTQITIPEKVTKIESWTFGNCSNLTDVVIHGRIEKIEMSTFQNCGELTSVTIPVNVNNIGIQAFYQCNKLRDVYYTGTESQWNAITIGSNNTPLTKATTIKHFESTGPITP